MFWFLVFYLNILRFRFIYTMDYWGVWRRKISEGPRADKFSVLCATQGASRTVWARSAIEAHLA